MRKYKFQSNLNCGRKKLRNIVIFVIVIGIMFVYFQMVSVKLINSENVTPQMVSVKLINSENVTPATYTHVKVRGIKEIDSQKYLPNTRGKFVCHKSKQEIDYSMINDDFCDCPLDGSDEPGTSACGNTKFHCDSELSDTVSVVSSRVNDGICDCCDGSDEWAQLFFPFRLSERLQTKLGRYHSPCPNLCPDDF